MNLQNRLEIAEVIAAILGLVVMGWFAKRAERIAERHAQEFMANMAALLASLVPRASPSSDPERGDLWNAEVITRPEPALIPLRPLNSGQAAAGARGDPVEEEQPEDRQARPLTSLPSWPTESSRWSSAQVTAVCTDLNPTTGVRGVDLDRTELIETRYVGSFSSNENNETSSTNGEVVAGSLMNTVASSGNEPGPPENTDLDADRSHRDGREYTIDIETGINTSADCRLDGSVQLERDIHPIVGEQVQVQVHLDEGEETV